MEVTFPGNSSYPLTAGERLNGKLTKIISKISYCCSNLKNVSYSNW